MHACMHVCTQTMACHAKLFNVQNLTDVKMKTIDRIIQMESMRSHQIKRLQRQDESKTNKIKNTSFGTDNLAVCERLE